MVWRRFLAEAGFDHKIGEILNGFEKPNMHPNATKTLFSAASNAVILVCEHVEGTGVCLFCWIYDLGSQF